MHHSIFPRDSKHMYLHRIAYCGDGQRVFECRGIFIHTQSIKDMITIKQELLTHIHNINMYKLQEDKNAHIIDWTMICCADIFMETDGDDIHVFHRINEESEEQWNQFLNKLDFEHDDESSRYALKGTVWYADGTWSKYGYDYEMMYGSWNWREVPMIPDYLHQ